MMIGYRQKSFDAEELWLRIDEHTPTSSAVNVWKEAHLHTKREQLAVMFRPAFSLDENGELRERSWHTWDG